jgi:hypothetical protein
MLREIDPVYGNVQFLGNSGINDGQGNLVPFFAFQDLIDIGVLRVMVVFFVSAKGVYIIKYMID